MTSSAVATAASAVNQAQPNAASGTRARCGGGNSTTDIKIDEHGRGCPRPAPATPAGRLLLGQDHQAVVGRRRARPGGQIVGARHPVPDRDPPADPARRQPVLDLVRTEPLRPAHGRPRPDRGAARPRSRNSPGASRSIRTPLEVRAQLTRAERNRPPRREGGSRAEYSRFAGTGVDEGTIGFRSDSRITIFDSSAATT